MWSVFLLMMCLAFKALASQIEGYGNTTADYGGEAFYKCKLDDPKDVLQVTWQRLYEGNSREGNSIENLATYSKRYGEQVNDPYQGKILFTEWSLRSTSIIVRNLTWRDESCYVCSFNAYPGGSKRHQTCLKVQGVSEVRTHASAPVAEPKNKDIKVVFSCSATGKPAPKIQWKHALHASSVEQSETSVLDNGDRTLTSSRNITLQLSSDRDAQVDCVINPGMRGEKRVTINYRGNKEKTENDTFLKPVVVVAIFAVLLAIVVIVFLFRAIKKLRPPTCEQNII